MPEAIGWRRYVHLRREEVWGERSATNPDIYVPCAEYSVRPRIETRWANVFVGLRQRRHGGAIRSMLAGRLIAPLIGCHAGGKSLAQWLIEWGVAGASTPFPQSYTVELSEVDVGDVRHLGLRVASMTLAGDIASGIVTIALELLGKEEMGGIAAPPLPSTSQPAEFLFRDASLFLTENEESSSNGAEIGIRSFRLTVENNPRPYHGASFVPSVLAAGAREVSLRFSTRKTSSAIDAIRRSRGATHRACRIVLLGRHLGTGPSGDFTKVEIALDRLSFTGAGERVRFTEWTTQEVDWIALKSEAASSDVDVEFSVV